VDASIPRLARLRLEGEELDEALVCRLGPEVFELHVHGSPVLVERLALALGTLAPTSAPAAASAPAIERSLEALARADLAHAPSEPAARILLDQAEGALSRALRALVAADPATRERAIDALLARARTARYALRPAEVVLAGPVNAGKSTLFNALLGEARAIVDATPGTTRDVLRERALLGTWPVRLVDTAGERALVSGSDDVERMGQAGGRRARTGADLVLWLAPVTDDEPPPPPGARTTVVRTFADRGAGRRPVKGAISALRDPAGARARVAEIFRTAFDLPEDAWTSGDGVPFTAAIAAAIAALRHVEGAALARRVEAILVGELGKRDDAFARTEPRA
jgi:tRNA modification GTPase